GTNVSGNGVGVGDGVGVGSGTGGLGPGHAVNKSARTAADPARIAECRGESMRMNVATGRARRSRSTLYRSRSKRSSGSPASVFSLQRKSARNTPVRGWRQRGQE